MKTKLLAIGLLLLLGACVQERVEPLTPDMQQQLALLPQEADLIGYINLQQIRESAVSKLFLDSAGMKMFHSDEFEEFKTATGFDFQKDTKSIYFAAGLDSNHKGMNGIFVATGNFDPEKIGSYKQERKLIFDVQHVEESFRRIAEKIY